MPLPETVYLVKVEQDKFEYDEPVWVDSVWSTSEAAHARAEAVRSELVEAGDVDDFKDELYGEPGAHTVEVLVLPFQVQ